MYTPRGELDDHILELLGREDVYQRLAACHDADEVRQTLESLSSISPEELEESLSVICSYLAEMGMSGALEGKKMRPLGQEELELVAGGIVSGDVRVRAALTDVVKKQPGFQNMANSLLMSMQK